MNKDEIHKIKKIKPHNVSRRYYLEPIAKKLKINPGEYKNRSVLHKAILSKLDKPSSRCENNCDPITLESIDDIEQKYLFEWDQNNRHYAADIRSLKAMIAKNVTILPWAIDSASGIQDAENHDKYVNKYDLKSVDGLIERINAYDVNFDFEYEKVPESIKYRFQLENCTNEYVTHIIDFIENFPHYRKLYYKALQEVCNQYNGEMFESNALSIKNVIILNLLTQISQTVLNDTKCEPLELLVMCVNTINVYLPDNSQNVIDLLFMFLNLLKTELTE